MDCLLHTTSCILDQQLSLLEIMQTVHSNEFHDRGKYVATAKATKEIVWLKKILEDLQEKLVNSSPLLVGNTFAIKLTKNPRFHD